MESVRQHSIYPTSCCIFLSCHALARLQHELQCNTSHTDENAVHAHGAYLPILSGTLPESLRPLRVESQCSSTISLSFLMMHFPFLRFKRPKHPPCRKSKCLECTWHLPKALCFDFEIWTSKDVWSLTILFDTQDTQKIDDIVELNLRPGHTCM